MPSNLGTRHDPVSTYIAAVGTARPGLSHTSKGEPYLQYTNTLRTLG